MIPQCIYCGQEYALARFEAGYHWCMDSVCVSQGLSGSMAKYRLILMPKQGFAYVLVDSPDLRSGKSSGR